ncbi:hypothetical protein [Phenylobacterium sp.]|uniref:hypothetical protein n=1 Tax=Phenylobacterium sp. TaxID=1871053 RepID=UPI002C7B3769|nr:hypothetical protein [Phenylobacterium sp.]HLZ74106.1 hypothetical protein [Phenylobacterium sp.]
MRDPSMPASAVATYSSAGARNRSFAKDIAELALFLDVTERVVPAGYLEAATAELAADRGIPATTLKRCASEARALIEFAHESGAVQRIASRINGSPLGLREDLAIWLDETNLTEVLKRRARRLQRRFGGRPSTRTRTLRAVEELLELAGDGRQDALDELDAIRALITAAMPGAMANRPAELHRPAAPRRVRSARMR